jgi:hypothetical protein
VEAGALVSLTAGVFGQNLGRHCNSMKPQCLSIPPSTNYQDLICMQRLDRMEKDTLLTRSAFVTFFWLMMPL